MILSIIFFTCYKTDISEFKKKQTDKYFDFEKNVYASSSSFAKVVGALANLDKEIWYVTTWTSN